MNFKFIRIALFLAIIFATTGAFAQKASKVGHISFNEVLEAMPGQDTVRVALEKYLNDLQQQLQVMQTEYENKALDYQKNVNSMSSIIKATKEKELTDLQTRIQAFQQSASQELSDKQMELISPFVEKAKGAIKEVAKEGGFSYIINQVEELILYSEGGEDVTPLVKKKLGIK